MSVQYYKNGVVRHVVDACLASTGFKTPLLRMHVAGMASLVFIDTCCISRDSGALTAVTATCLCFGNSRWGEIKMRNAD